MERVEAPALRPHHIDGIGLRGRPDSRAIGVERAAREAGSDCVAMEDNLGRGRYRGLQRTLHVVKK